tara:strand:+ start:557 stop:925 length:369 start_codon:yes stop_codon:yes gene_type:complete
MVIKTKDREPFYYYVELFCRDGENEYIDRFCITAPDLATLYNPQDDSADLIEQVLLDWNYGEVFWDGQFESYSNDGLRALQVGHITEIDYSRHQTLAKYLPSSDLRSVFEDKYNKVDSNDNK